MAFGSRIELKTPDQLRAMRRAGLVVADVHAQLAQAAKPGVSTAELDQLARDVLASHAATSNFLNYGAQWGLPPYPATLCASVNNVVVHGIPNDVPLQAGDLLSLDFGAIVDGWHGDAARTILVGGQDEPKDVALSGVTNGAMWAGIAAVAAGRRIGDVSDAIESHIRADGRWGIVREYTGHGIGTQMHMEPDVPNVGRTRRGAKISVGMCLAIEPIVTAGDPDVATLDDQWTVVTADGSRAAHWENTVAVTGGGLWVLTEPDGGQERLAGLNVPFGPLAD